MIENETTLRKASFNPKVKTYIFLVVLFYLCVSIAGLIIVPFWLFGLGQWLSKKFFHTLQCQLSTKNLKFSKGIIFHIEKTIPLENIQDLSFYGGPVLRSFGLTLIRIETAGGGGHHNNNMMSMLGIEDAEQFKQEILEQREKVIRQKHQHPGATTVNPGIGLNEQLLTEIRNELVEIKIALKK
jgi:putative membrane protein